MKSAIAAVKAIEAARPLVTKNGAEFDRLANDMHCMEAQYRYYNAKTRAAALVLRYGHSHDLADLRAALPLLRESLQHYRSLVALTDRTYREGPSVHSSSRRIPFLGAPGRYTHWRDCLPVYQQELATFERHLKLLESSGPQITERARPPLPGLSPRLLSDRAETFSVEPGAKLYTDAGASISQLAPELRGLTGIRVPQAGGQLTFELPEPAQILVGFFRSEKRNAAAQPPKDEWEPILHNGVIANGQPAFTVYSHALPQGRSQLDFGRGAYVVLGFIKKDAQPEPRVVFLAQDAKGRADLDWLFE